MGMAQILLNNKTVYSCDGLASHPGISSGDNGVTWLDADFTFTLVNFTPVYPD